MDESIETALNDIDRYQVIDQRNDKTVDLTTSLNEKSKLAYRELIDNLTPLATEVSPKVLEEQRRVANLLQDEAKQRGLEIQPPVVLYLDGANTGKVDEILKKDSIDIHHIYRSRQSMLGKAFSWGPVVVVFKKNGESDLSLAADTYHELKHHFRYEEYKITPDSSKEISVSGAGIVTHNGQVKGHFFEEGYVLSSTADYLEKSARYTFPKDYQTMKGAIAGLSHQPKDNKDVLGESFDDLSRNVPDIKTDIEQARLTGIWKNVGGKIDKFYGPGAFKTLMSITARQTDNKETTIMVRRFITGSLSLNELNKHLSSALPAPAATAAEPASSSATREA